MTRKSSAPKDAAARLLKQAQALKLRALGHNYRSIANGLGVSLASAHSLVNTAMAAERKEIGESKANLIALEIVRCDTYLQALSIQITKGSARAIDTALRVAERRAKLKGLDAPTKVASTTGDGKDLFTPTQLLRAAEEIKAKGGR